MSDDNEKPMLLSQWRTLWRKLFWRKPETKPESLSWVLMLVDYEDGDQPAVWFGVWTGTIWRGFAAEKFFVPFDYYYAFLRTALTDDHVPPITGKVIRWQHVQLTL